MSKRKTKQPLAKGGGRPATPATVLAEVRAAAEHRAARMARRQEARTALARQRRQRLLRYGGLASLAVLVVGSVLTVALRREVHTLEGSVSIQSSPHIPTLDTPHAPYNTDPPTSGPHLNQVPPWGVAATPIANELQVQALEDGGVILHYQARLDPRTVEELKTLTGSFSKDVILNSAPGLTSPIVLTAWGQIQRLTMYDEARIRRFIETFRGIDHHQESGS